MSRFSTEVVGACLASMVFGGAVVYFLLGRGKQRGVPEAAPAPDGEQRGADAGAGSGAGAGGAADGASADVDEPCKMVMVVRMDLKMGKGKIAAQVRSSAGSHAHAPSGQLTQVTATGATSVATPCLGHTRRHNRSTSTTLMHGRNTARRKSR